VDPDPGSRIFFDHGSGIRDGKFRIRDKHIGSTTLATGNKANRQKLLILGILKSFEENYKEKEWDPGRTNTLKIRSTGR
jgi:hypothetical protein